MGVIEDATAPVAPTDRQAFSVDRAAETLSLGASTIWRLIKAGRLKTVKLGGRTLIRREELLRLLDAAEASQLDSLQS